MRISHFPTTLQNVRKAPDHPNCTSTYVCIGVSSPCFSTNFNVSRTFLRPLLIMGSGAFYPRFNQFMLNLKAINLSKKQGLIGEYLISGLERARK